MSIHDRLSAKLNAPMATILKTCYEQGFKDAREAAARACEKSYRDLSTEDFDNQTPTQARRHAAQAIRALTLGDLDPMHVTPIETPPLASRT